MTKIKLKRKYLPWETWEEVKHGMWSDIDNKPDALQLAIQFTGDHNAYGQAMLRVVKEWPNSCENALTDYSLNRKAWIGHAACALAHGLPEDIVRMAWGRLSDEQRLLANKAAARAIREWEINYIAHNGLHTDVGSAVLFEWNT